MNLIRQTIITVCVLVFLTSCRNIKEDKMSSTSIETNANEVDTLKIEYSDTILVGKKLFPITPDSNKLKDILNENILLVFESGNYYYIFHNKIKKLDFLSSKYWEQLMPKYVNFKIEDGLLSYSRFSKVSYHDPFLTAFYNSEDSIIIQGYDLNREYLLSQNEFSVSYFSTSDTLFKLNNNISVGKSLEDVLLELQTPNFLKPKTEFNLVLMEATTQIDNAWYNNYPENYSDYSVTVILSIRNNKLIRIQYLDLEYIDYIFKQKSISTSDVHYH